MDTMETVVGRLAEIEMAAVALEESVTRQKEEIAEEYEKKTAEFDERVDARTDQKLRQLAEKLGAEADAELKRMRREMEAELSGMEEEYRQNHKKLALKIVREMTEG